MKRLLLAFLFLITICSIQCLDGRATSEIQTVKEEYPRWIEDIAYDPTIDNPNFQTCHGDDMVYQYFNLGDNIEIEGERYYIDRTFEKEYNASIAAKESGLVRVRFLVNCMGDTDRFRLLTSDLKFQAYEMSPSITNQLVRITKSLTGWKQKFDSENQAVDYYQYLVFRIVDGKISNIQPWEVLYSCYSLAPNW